MFSLGIKFLTGLYRATHPSSRSEPEWPPHPGRIFMALAATHFETEGNQVEREALLWLEALPEPSLHVSKHQSRQSTTVYVSANDVEVPTGKKSEALPLAKLKVFEEKLKELLPEGRKKNSRFFPVSIPDFPCVYLIWPNTSPNDDMMSAISRICNKVSYLGHSSSLVHIWLEENPPKPNLIPWDHNPDIFLRVPGPGRLNVLERRFEVDLRPDQGLWKGYVSVKRDHVAKYVPRPSFDSDIIVLNKIKGSPLGLESTLKITSTLRRGVLRKLLDDYGHIPEWITGLNEDGKDNRSPHLAYIPLADVGHVHADGHLMGIGMVFPSVIDRQSVHQFIRSLFPRLSQDQSSVLEIDDMDSINWTLEFDKREDRPIALRPETWIYGFENQPARKWGTVTPIVLDKYSKGSNALAQTEKTIALSCERISLPRPIAVDVLPTSPILGVPSAKSFPNAIHKNSGAKRPHTHARIVFEEPVQGPIILGAGRYLGYGLCRPIRSQVKSGTFIK